MSLTKKLHDTDTPFGRYYHDALEVRDAVRELQSRRATWIEEGKFNEERFMHDIEELFGKEYSLRKPEGRGYCK